MKQKTVIKVQMSCQKYRTKALQIAAAADGVESVALGEDETQVVVIGQNVNLVCLIDSLRKKVGHAEIMSVAVVKPAEKEKKKEPILLILAFIQTIFSVFSYVFSSS